MWNVLLLGFRCKRFAKDLLSIKDTILIAEEIRAGFVVNNGFNFTRKHRKLVTHYWEIQKP